MNNQKLKNRSKHQQKQQGIALVMALIMLLLITMIGVSAVRMSNLDTQVSGNSIFSAIVYQGAESALGRSVPDGDISNLIPAAFTRGDTSQIPATYFDPVETVTGGAKLNSSADIVYEKSLNYPPYGIFANGEGEIEYQLFRVNATSRLASTSAKDRHSEGIVRPKPPEY